MTATEGLVQVSTLATSSAMSAWSFVSDFAIILVIVLLFVMFARSIGRGPFVGLLIAFYCAYALYAMFPYMSFLPTAPAMTALLAQVGLYLGLTLAFYIILRRVVVSDFLYIGLFGLLTLSFLGAAFLLALAYHVFPVDSVYHFTPALDLLFASKSYFWWWFVAPAVGLFFFAR
ncbi:MAG: hypothetical protein WC217_02875 [Candidatus Paceibacterota bacterium]|jgi:hypothetical protein